MPGDYPTAVHADCDSERRQPTMAWANSHREMTGFRLLTEGPQPNKFSYFVHEVHEDRFVIHITGPTEYLREWFMGTCGRPSGLASHKKVE